MLEEKTDPKFKSYIIKLVLAVLLLFLLMWLFPTKGFLTKKIDESINEKLDASAPQIFNENVKIMGDAAQDYFTGSRLPKNGKTVKITLGEMLEKHLLVEFTDSKNSTCDKKESYVEVTNEKSEYIMKVNLSCTDIKDYVIIYLFPSTVVTSASSNANSCKYEKITNAKWDDYSEWLNWQTEKILKTDYNQIETKTEKIYIGTKEVLNNEENSPVKEEVKQYVCSNSYDNAGIYSKETTKITASMFYMMKFQKIWIRRCVNMLTLKWIKCLKSLTVTFVKQRKKSLTKMYLVILLKFSLIAKNGLVCHYIT